MAGLLGGWALLVMVKRRTPVEPWKDPLHLVTSGPFRWTRNPLYVTLSTLLLALAIMANSAWLGAFAVVLPLLLDRLVIRREEEILERTFGSDYTTYKDRVRRWL